MSKRAACESCSRLFGTRTCPPDDGSGLCWQCQGKARPEASRTDTIDPRVRLAVRWLFADLGDRRGLKSELRQIDPEIADEMRALWERAIAACLNMSLVEAAEALSSEHGPLRTLRDHGVTHD